MDSKENSGFNAVFGGGGSGSSGGGVQSVTGLATNNTDPLNPIVEIAVDPSLTGDGTPASPLMVSRVSSNPSTLAIQSGNATIVNTAGVSISASFLITANTLNPSCVIDFVTRVKRMSGSTSMFFVQIYINTSNSLTGATLIGKSLLGSGTTTIMQMQRTYNISSNFLFAFSGGTQAITDIQSSTDPLDTIGINVTIDNYFIIAISNSSTDSLVCDMAKLIQSS